MADQQVALERLRELYREKNEHLEKFLEPVEPYEFYREIFPEGSFERKGHFEDNVQHPCMCLVRLWMYGHISHSVLFSA